MEASKMPSVPNHPIQVPAIDIDPDDDGDDDDNNKKSPLEQSAHTIGHRLYQAGFKDASQKIDNAFSNVIINLKNLQDVGSRCQFWWKPKGNESLPKKRCKTTLDLMKNKNGRWYCHKHNGTINRSRSKKKRAA